MSRDLLPRRLRHLAVAAGLGVLIAITATAAASAQDKPMRIRGTIEKVDGDVLAIKSREGEIVTVKLAEKLVVRAVVKLTLADLRAGTMIGSAAMPQPDGSLKALEVHVFPPELKVNSGHTPFDLKPQSTMTNGTIEATVVGSNGPVLTVKYNQGGKSEEKKIAVASDIPIVTYAPGDRSELKAGTAVMIFRAVKGPDGMLTTEGVTVGRNGVNPPM